MTFASRKAFLILSAGDPWSMSHIDPIYFGQFSAVPQDSFVNIWPNFFREFVLKL